MNVDQRQIEYWDELIEEIKQVTKQHDPATAYAMIRRLRSVKKRSEHMPILKNQVKLLCNAGETLEGFRKFFSELLNVTSAIDLMFIVLIKLAKIFFIEKTNQEKLPTLVEVQIWVWVWVRHTHTHTHSFISRYNARVSMN